MPEDEESEAVVKLVVAEKPSVARAIAACVGANARREGYLEGGGWLVTWCRGHLVDLALPDEYPQWEGEWDEARLPMVPCEWKWRASGEKGAAAQLRAVEPLMRRGDVELVVNACDADREGEGIFRRVYRHAGCAKPVMRFWSTSLTEEAVAKDLAAMRGGSEYDGLGAAAEGRAKADWLVGLNATRAYTCLAGAGVTAGRAQTPVLAMVAQRTREAAAFEPADFFQAVATCENGLVLESERLDAEEAADRAAAALRAAGAVEVVRAEYKDAKAKAPALFDLTALQRAASERYGMTAERTLSAMQALYEAKLLTYPRTDSRYITTDDLGEARLALAAVACDGVAGREACEALRASGADLAKLANDGKVSGHGAVMPTPRLTATALAGLGEDERNVCRLVATRLVAAVMPPAVRRKAKVEAVCPADGAVYAASSSEVLEESWLAADDASKRKGDDGRPPIPEGICEGGRLALAGAETRRGKTSPPKPYTDSTLLSAMESCGRRMADAELAAAIDDDTTHSGGLGTPATRAETIEGLVRRGYIRRKGKSLEATQAGLAVVDCVDDSLKSAELTARWELELAAVERGEADLNGFLEGIAGYAAAVVDGARAQVTPERAAALRAALGSGPAPLEGCSCPRCGAQVLLGRKKASCSSNRYERGADGCWTLADGCGWEMWAEVARKRLTERQLSAVVRGETAQVKGLRSKAGKTFAAGVRLKGDGTAGETELVFDQAENLEGCACPGCGGQVRRRGKRAECAGGCGWGIWADAARKQLTDRQLARVLDGETVQVKGLRSKAGKTFSAGVRLKDDASGLELAFG